MSLQYPGCLLGKLIEKAGKTFWPNVQIEIQRSGLRIRRLAHKPPPYRRRCLTGLQQANIFNIQLAIESIIRVQSAGSTSSPAGEIPCRSLAEKWSEKSAELLIQLIQFVQASIL